MAPMCPEEVDVFSVPHSRMKELVCQYLDMLTATNFRDASNMAALLKNLIKTFREFIAHEQIENQFIMKKLKDKLRSLSIQNTAVCNCHKDNQLLDMLKMLQDGYKCTRKTDADRLNYGLQLRQALEEFTETFLPHMAEEEQVFQPLLIEHFTWEELKQIKATVIQQHFKVEPDDAQEKCVADNKSSKGTLKTCVSQTEQEEQQSIEQLPNEVLLKIFSNLNAKDLSRCAQVSRKWNDLALDGSLWTELYPVSWAEGQWDSAGGVYEEEKQDVLSKLECKALDEDADVDEADDWSTEAIQIQYQSRKLTSMCKYLLPRIGRSVSTCDLAYSKGLTNGLLYKILSLCPNLQHLDLTQTRVSDLGFKGFKNRSCGRKLRHLDLSGCLYITDLTLQRLATAIGQKPANKSQGQAKGQGCCGSEKGGKKSASMKKEDSFDEEKNECDQCAHNQAGCHGDAGRGETSCHNETGSAEQCVDGAGTTCIGGRQCCGGLELKSTCTNHEQCPRAGPCQASRVDGAGDCCDIEGRAGYNTRTMGQCADCDKIGCPDNDGYRTEVPPRSDHEYKLRLAARVLMDSGVVPDTEKNGPGVDADKYGYHGGEGQRSRFEGNDLESEERVSQTWQGSTIEHLSEIDENTVPMLVSMKSGADERLEVGEAHQTSVTIGRRRPKDVDEGTPSDYNPRHTYLPDFILLPNTMDCHADVDDDNHGNTSYCHGNANSSQGDVGDCCHGDQRESDFMKNGSPDCDRHLAESDGDDQARDTGHVGDTAPCLEYLSLSGCYQITEEGLMSLAGNGGLPCLRHLDLSGCSNIEGEALSALVQTAPLLNPAHLYYCDNIEDGPYIDEASGCQNLQCGSRLCCRGGD